jgi:hypothetical protein
MWCSAMENRDALIDEIRRHWGDSSFSAICELIKTYISRDQLKLETATLEEIPFLQGKIKACRSLLRDMTGQSNAKPA